MTSISIFGFGRLGSCLGAALASKGHRITGIEVNDDLVRSINDREAPFPEPQLQDYLDAHGDRISATTDAEQAVTETDVSFVLVPTPSTDDGSFDASYVMDVIETIEGPLAEKDDFHLVTIASTVSPGTVETIRRALEEGTGGTCGEDWGLCYSPWFISQGTVIEDFINPEIVMIGSDDDRSEDTLEDVLDTLIESDPTVTRMSFVSAEIAKITFNVYSTMKISFANQMGWICGRHENADVDVVMESIKHDDRIGGPKLFTAGLGFGGPCLPRDNRAFRAFTDVPERYDFGRVTDSINHAMPSMVVDQIESVANSDETVGVLGLSYKPRTDMTKESQSLVISELLADRRDAPVLTYDPKAPERNCETLGELVESVDVLLLLTPWPEFESVDAETLREKKVVDMWRFFDADIREADDDYWAFGVDFPRSRGFENLTDFE